MPIYHNGVWFDETADSIKVPREEFPGPTINTQPAGATITEGVVHNLTVAATSNLPHNANLTYQWYQGVLGDGSDWVAISGATAATYAYTGVLNDPAGLKFVCNVFDSRQQVTQTTVATMVVEAAVSLSFNAGGSITGNPATVNATVIPANPSRRIIMMTFQRGWSASNQTVTCTTTGEVGVQLFVAHETINSSSTAGSIQVWDFPVTAAAPDTALAFSIGGAAEWGRVWGVWSGIAPGAYQAAASALTTEGHAANPCVANALPSNLTAGMNVFCLGISTNTGGSATNTFSAAADPNSGAALVSDQAASERGLAHALVKASDYPAWSAGWPWSVSYTAYGGAAGVVTLGYA